MPHAVLVRVIRFASAMNAVNSTKAGAPGSSSSRADSSSVTVDSGQAHRAALVDENQPERA